MTSQNAHLVLLVVTVGWNCRASTGVFQVRGKFYAESARFAAAELIGFMALKPGQGTILFFYPPVYTDLFALCLSLFGFGYMPCVVFGALIHLALVAISLWLGAKRDALLLWSLPEEQGGTCKHATPGCADSRASHGDCWRALMVGGA